jgi:pimeloyl-ACP methyl ester carboxylesterase
MIRHSSLGRFFAIGLILMMLTGALEYPALGRNRNPKTSSGRSPERVNEEMFVKIGGIDQWIQIRGESSSNPVLLVLHGGPGFSYLPLTAVFGQWEKDFTVVQWDQRGAGKTFGRNGKTGSGPMTLERMTQDGIEVVEFLRQHLHQKKIILLAHSWGTVLGLPMVARRPDLFYAYIGTGQIVNMARNEAASYDLVLNRVRALGDEKAIRALEGIGRPPYKGIETWMTKGTMVVMYAPPSASGRTLPNVFTPDIIAGFNFSIEKLYEELMGYDATRLGTRFKVPIFIFQGDADIQSPTALAKEFFSSIRAPKKDLVLLKGEGHNALLLLPDVFLKEMVTRVRPLAIKPEGLKQNG